MPELKSKNGDPMTGGPDFLTIEHDTDFVEIVRFFDYLLFNFYLLT
jgi:hypothetical protein